MKNDYSSLFISAVLLLAAGLALEGTITTSSAGKFFEGLLIGMSIACGVIGFIVYSQSSKKGMT